jgi:hypothetical protein
MGIRRAVRLREDARRDLQRWFEDFKKMRFPKAPSGEEEAGHLRTELVLYDAYVAGYLTQLFADADLDSKRLYLNVTLKGELEEFGKRRPDLAVFVGGCLDYLNVVHGLIRSSKEKAVQ